jgi:pSer/pThr/pTyr-binding forkhead associated (FHA) protein
MAAKPAQPVTDHLLILRDDKGRKEVIMREARYTLGRAENCSIRIQSQFVSRYHAIVCRFMREDGTIGYRIIDGDEQGKASVNGLMINGKKSSSHELKDGDTVVFGPQVFAIYQHRRYDNFPTIPPDDPFDITLIDPAMIGNDGEDN